MEMKFKDFRHAMGFVNKVAEIAESEGHHPDIYGILVEQGKADKQHARDKRPLDKRLHTCGKDKPIK